MASQVVSPEKWLAARKELLKKEKEITRQLDELSRQRRELPRVKIEKQYVFDGPRGKETLSDLFAGRSQLVVKHFMMGPGWKEGCVGCSFGSDHLDATLVHLEHHDVSVVAVSRATYAEIEPFQRRMGWRFHWVSSFGNEFNYDFHVSFTPEQMAKEKAYYNYTEGPVWGEEASGLSVFQKDANGDVFHTYSTYGRGDEMLLGTYVILDITPNGRNETGPRKNLTDWVRHHDRYEAGGLVDSTGRYVPAKVSEPCCHEREGQA
jgi:predicted dithiol-disulfide oxidoreductase (DUF899 family)